LPSIFIYKDLKQQKFTYNTLRKYGFTPAIQQSFLHGSGNRVMTYTAGMSVMYLPFFAIAHATAKPLGYPADGFSMPYAFMLTIGSALMAFIGLWYFRKLLLYYYTDRVVAIVLFLLVFGTNYLAYSTLNGTLTHNWLFTLYVLLLLNTRSFYLNPNYRNAAWIGMITGLLILIRPSEIVSALIPLLWGIETIKANVFKQRLLFFKRHLKVVMLAVFFTALVASVQSIYWLYVTGEVFVYTLDYSFSWLHPHLFDYSLSYRSGWLTYTPMMLLLPLALIAHLFYGVNKLAFTAFFLVSLYIVSAWDIWWYGGTGGRAMVQSYPVLFFFIASLVTYLSATRYIKWLAAPFMVLFIYFNLWIFYQSYSINGVFSAQGVTKEYFWAGVLRWKASEEINKLKDTDELHTGSLKDRQLLYTNNFEDDTTGYDVVLLPLEGKHSAILTQAHPYSPPAAFAYVPGKAGWLRAQATLWCKNSEWNEWKMVQFIVRFMDNDKIVKERMIRVNRLLKRGQKKDVYMDVKIPEENFNSVAVFFWNPGSDYYVVADDLRVWSFNE
jgi:hypothetical protein